MTDKHELLRTVERARQVKEFLDHPILNEAVASLTKGILADFAAADPAEPAKLSHHRYRLQAVQALVEALRNAVDEGANAAAEFKNVEKIEQLRKLNLVG